MKGQIDLESVELRLTSRLVTNEETGCMEFNGARTALMYGRMSAGRGNHLKAHRAAYMVWVGEIPDGFSVCHKCDNPPCCNPSHLFLGTVADNNEDRRAKGRTRPRGKAINPRRGDENMPRGEKNGNSKLTEDTVRGIRCFSGTLNQCASHFNVPRGTCADIRANKTWRHVA